ncbi:alanine racemase [Campylobacterota bacterium]|nr:alanine racemase [Campylobacterota bacterium]
MFIVREPSKPSYYNDEMSLVKLNKAALFHNISVLQERAGTARIAAVLKDNAYGHGLAPIAALCAEAGIRAAVVRTAKDAEAIAPLFGEVLALADLPSAAGNAPNVSFALNDRGAIAHFGAGAAAHIKIDSGMHRNGIDIADLENAMAELTDRGVAVRGVFSHLRAADVLSSEFFWQEKNFAAARKRVLSICERRNLPKPAFHLYNSAALLRSRHAHEFDLVRPGIALYGYSDLPALFNPPPLKPVLSLWADRISRRAMKSGFRVGYGGVGRIDGDAAASVYDIGYGDGFLRLNGTEGYRTPCGKRLLGRVSMDSVIVEGSEEQICLMDNAETIAALRGTISYEALVRLDAGIRRVVV